MMIIKTTHHYHLFQDGKDFVVTTKKRIEVFRGTQADCENYMDLHPYGTKTR